MKAFLVLNDLNLHLDFLRSPGQERSILVFKDSFFQWKTSQNLGDWLFWSENIRKTFLEIKFNKDTNKLYLVLTFINF